MWQNAHDAYLESRVLAAAPGIVGVPAHAVDQQYVQPAIGIVIEEGAAGAHSLGQVLGAERAAVVAELNARGRGDVGQAEVQARRVGGQSPRRRAAQKSPSQEPPASHAMLTRPWRMA